MDRAWVRAAAPARKVRRFPNQPSSMERTCARHVSTRAPTREGDRPAQWAGASLTGFGAPCRGFARLATETTELRVSERTVWRRCAPNRDAEIERLERIAEERGDTTNDRSGRSKRKRLRGVGR
jgi:hypothetical protein